MICLSYSNEKRRVIKPRRINTVNRDGFFIDKMIAIKTPVR